MVELLHVVQCRLGTLNVLVGAPKVNSLVGYEKRLRRQHLIKYFPHNAYSNKLGSVKMILLFCYLFLSVVNGSGVSVSTNIVKVSFQNANVSVWRDLRP